MAANQEGAQAKVNIEYVSSIPTAISISATAGGEFWEMCCPAFMRPMATRWTREYYVNDYGSQIQKVWPVCGQPVFPPFLAGNMIP